LLESNYEKHQFCEIILRDYQLKIFNRVYYDPQADNYSYQIRSLWGHESENAVKKAMPQFKENYRKELEEDLLTSTTSQDFISKYGLKWNGNAVQLYEIVRGMLEAGLISANNVKAAMNAFAEIFGLEINPDRCWQNIRKRKSKDILDIGDALRGQTYSHTLNKMMVALDKEIDCIEE
jgi:hypothetical protein